MRCNYRLWLIVIICALVYGCSNTPEELHIADKVMESAPDSALHILQRINSHRVFEPSNKALYALLLSQALDKNDKKVESDSLIQIATNYFTADEPVRAGYAWFYRARCANNRGSANEQGIALLKAQEFARKSNNFKLQGLIFADKAKMYLSQLQLDSSLHYFKLSFRAYQQVNDRYNSVINLINLGYTFLYKSKTDSAIIYFRFAEKMSVTLHDSLLTSTIYRSLGTAYYEKGIYPTALNYYKRAPLTGIEIYDTNKWYLISKVFVETGKLDSARIFLNKIKHLHEMAPDYYQMWMKLHEKEGNYSNALYFAKRVTEAKDSMNEHTLSVSFAGLEKKYKFQQLEVENKDLIIKNKQHSNLFLVLLFIVSVFAMLFLYWRLKVKKHQLDFQTQLVEKEKENTHLLEQQLKMGNILLLNVEQYRKHSVKRINSAGGEHGIINTSLNQTFHEELIACMDLQHNKISKRLAVNFPELTDRDILVCCLLLANFNSGMIASILDVQSESVTKHRYRLRTKLGLLSHENLIDKLFSF